MKYLPILQELFESDTVIFLIIGMAIALIVGLRIKNHNKCIAAIGISIAAYVICELVSNFHTNFMLELILLFVGTAAIGCCIGLIICLLIKFIKNKNIKN